jgi:hypothetical protein
MSLIFDVPNASYVEMALSRFPLVTTPTIEYAPTALPYVRWDLT